MEVDPLTISSRIKFKVTQNGVQLRIKVKGESVTYRLSLDQTKAAILDFHWQIDEPCRTPVGSTGGILTIPTRLGHGDNFWSDHCEGAYSCVADVLDGYGPSGPRTIYRSVNLEPVFAFEDPRTGEVHVYPDMETATQDYQEMVKRNLIDE